VVMPAPVYGDFLIALQFNVSFTSLCHIKRQGRVGR